MIKKQYNPVILMIPMFILIMAANFFLTANPYQALHSGKVAYGSVYTSATWFFEYKFAVLIPLIFVCGIMAYARKSIKIKKSVICFLSVIVVVNCLNGSVFSETTTLIYNIITIAMTSIVARVEQKDACELDGILKKIWVVLFLIFIIAFILAVAFPNRYGYVNFGFSRSDRGEMTFWNIFGLSPFFLGLSFLLYEKEKKTRYIIAPVCNLVMQLSFYSRMNVIISVIPFVIFFGVRTKGNVKLLIWILIIALSPFIIELAYNFITIQSVIGAAKASDYLTVLTSGRNELWEYYWKGFLSQPILGNGLNYQENILYTGAATSEISLLKWYGEQGAIASTIWLVFLIKAFRKSLAVIKTNQINSWNLIMAYVFLSEFIQTILQSNSRILSISNFMVWYSMFYLCWMQIDVSDLKEDTVLSQ